MIIRANILEEGELDKFSGFSDSIIYVGKEYIHINDIVLNREGGKGRISQEKTIEFVTEAIKCGADILVKFNNTSISLSGE